MNKDKMGFEELVSTGKEIIVDRSDAQVDHHTIVRCANWGRGQLDIANYRVGSGQVRLIGLWVKQVELKNKQF